MARYRLSSFGMAKYVHKQESCHIAMSEKHVLRMYLQAITFLICFTLFCLIITVSPAYAGELFNPRNCEFSVEFPAKPKVQEILVPALGKIQSAELRVGAKGSTSGYVFTAEGYPVSRSDILKQHEDIKTYFYSSLQEYASANGIQSAEFKYFKDKNGEGMFMRGYKNISGQRVIYSTMSILGDSSILSLRVGAPAQDFPPPGFSPFFQSVRRK